MKKFSIIALAFISLVFVSCKKEQTREEAISEFQSQLTAQDSTIMLEICNDCMDLLRDGKVEDALNSLYEYDDSTGVVSPLSKEMRNRLSRQFAIFPVLEYELDYFSFQLEGCNDVRYNVIFRDGGDEQTGEFVTKFMFNPVKVDETWYLSVKRGDQLFDNSKQ